MSQREVYEGTMNKPTSRLIDMKNGAVVRITTMDGNPGYAQRLNRFGVYIGDTARVVRRAPFDGPILLEVAGMEIALGVSIAAHILVEVVR